MEEKIRLAVFGQKRLSREGGIEIVVKELCTRMAQNGFIALAVRQMETQLTLFPDCLACRAKKPL